MDYTKTTSVFAALIAALMLIAAVSGGAMAAPTVTTDSQVADGDMVYVDASDDDPKDLEFELNNSATTSVDVTITDLNASSDGTNTTLATMSDADASVYNESGTWTAELSQADLANTNERDLGETYTVEAEIAHTHDDDGDGTDTTATETITFDVEIVSTADSQRVLVSDALNDTDVGADVIVESDEGFLGTGYFADDTDTYDATRNFPNGHENYTNATYVMDGDAASAFDGTAEDTSSGDPIPGMTVMVQGELVPVYADESGDFHEDNSSYAVYNTSSSELDVEFGDDRSDAFATDVRVVNTNPVDEIGFRATGAAYDYRTAADFWI